MKQKGTKHKMDILHASPKDKAIAYCLGYADPSGGQEYTKEESIEILESLSPEDRKIFFKWTRIYAVFAEIIPDFSLFHREYVLSLHEVEKLLDDLSSKELEIAHFKYIRSTLSDRSKAKFDKEVESIFNTKKIDPLTCKWVNVEMYLPDGKPLYNLRPTPHFMDELQIKVSTMAFFGCAYSSYAKALTIWIANKKASAIEPPMLKELLSAYKEKSHQSTIIDYYSVSGIEKSERKGESVSMARKEVSAILPLFEDMIPDEDEVEKIINQLNRRLDETGKKK